MHIKFAVDTGRAITASFPARIQEVRNEKTEHKNMCGTSSILSKHNIERESFNVSFHNSYVFLRYMISISTAVLCINVPKD